MGIGPRIGLGLGFGMGLAGMARAECVSAACNAQITVFLTMVALFALLGCAILVMLLRAKWRKVGLILLAVSLTVFVGIPLALQGWRALERLAMERREILGQPPLMAERTPLVIVPEWGCSVGACESVLIGRGAAGAYVLDRQSLDRLDRTKPIPLADLPIRFQSYSREGNQRVTRELDAEARRAAAASIDYVVLVGPFLDGFHFERAPTPTTGRVDHLLRGNPALAGQTAREVVSFAMAPLDPARGELPFAELRFDLLDLWFAGTAPGIPLAPGPWKPLRNASATADLAAASICPLGNGERDWFCVNGLK